MDALSSMANIAGYRAVIEAANNFASLPGRLLPQGRCRPAGADRCCVAGPAAIGTARVCAVVRAFDTRPVVKEQVQSLGQSFELSFPEDGTGEGGYAKVMSDEFIKAEMACSPPRLQRWT